MPRTYPPVPLVKPAWLGNSAVVSCGIIGGMSDNTFIWPTLAYVADDVHRVPEANIWSFGTYRGE